MGWDTVGDWGEGKGRILGPAEWSRATSLA